jgi:glycosyltransferase involved in cell wall biosynthesis
MDSIETPPLVSVIIPTYDRPETLPEALRSIAGQKYENVEVIVVDDHSPTPIKKDVELIPEEFPYPLKIVRHDENKGASAARNTGIKHAGGDYVTFLDDDDRWKENKIRRQIKEFLRSENDVGLVYTGRRFVTGENKMIRVDIPDRKGEVTKDILCENFVGSFSTVMVRAEVIEEVGDLDERFPCWQDIEWYIRISESWNFSVVSEPLVSIQQSDGVAQISDQYNIIESVGKNLFIEKYRPLAASYGWLFERKFLGWVEFRIGAYNALRTGRYRSARRHLIQALRWYPFAWQFWVYFFISLGGKYTYEIAKKTKRALGST